MIYQDAISGRFFVSVDYKIGIQLYDVGTFNCILAAGLATEAKQQKSRKSLNVWF